MIRKATAADIDAIEASYNELFEHERRNGSLTQWIQGLYPTRATAEGGVERGEMYVYYIDDKLAASMILNSHQPAEYYDIPWVYDASDEEVMVIHTLCVPPSMSGRGLGTLMVGFATGFALGAGKRVMLAAHMDHIGFIATRTSPPSGSTRSSATAWPAATTACTRASWTPRWYISNTCFDSAKAPVSN